MRVRIKKSEVHRLLAKHGLTARRTNTAGMNSWTLSNGEIYPDLLSIYNDYVGLVVTDRKDSHDKDNESQS